MGLFASNLPGLPKIISKSISKIADYEYDTRDTKKTQNGTSKIEPEIRNLE